jgi:hypothetical protein
MAYHSFAGEVEARTPPRYAAFIPSARHQLSRIAPPERARLDIFERVNSGEPLTRQQMRNALYNGPATVWLKQAAEGDAFRSATGSSLNPKTMRDREAINRFCAFKLLGYNDYTTSDMDGFLAKGLNRLEKLNDAEGADLRIGFDRTMTLNRKLFGDHAFRKSLASTDPAASRSVINISLFESAPSRCLASEQIRIKKFGSGSAKL